MAEQQLDGAEIGTGFQQMNCKCVAQRMRSNRFVDAAQQPGWLPFTGAQIVEALRVAAIMSLMGAALLAAARKRGIRFPGGPTELIAAAAAPRAGA